MSTVAKILVVLNLLLAGYFLSSASSFLAQQDKLQKDLEAEQEAHDVTRSTKDDEIGSLRGRLNGLQTDLQKTQTEAEKLRAETTRVAGENTTIDMNCGVQDKRVKAIFTPDTEETGGDEVRGEIRVLEFLEAPDTPR